MKTDVVKKVLGEKRDSLSARRNTAQLLREKAYAIPEISAAQAVYSDARFNAMREGKDASSPAVLKAKKKYFSVLEEFGYSEKDFEVEYSCPVCKDTGIHDGKICKCVWTDYVKSLAAKCEIDRRAPFSFADCKLDGADEKQRAALSKLYEAMSAYVDKFPAVKYLVITLSGNTGTGKSCLASAMVRKAVLEKGESALLMSAYEVNSTFLKCHTSPLSERESIMSDVMSADYLVIDDLGTEPMLKNVTVEYLQLLIEERTRAGLATIITTNMSTEQLYDRYGERIFSRLSNKENAMMRRITGKDLRINR